MISLFLYKMKKILSILILTVLVVGLVAPLMASAQKEKLKECCTVRQDMSWKKGAITIGTGTDVNTISGNVYAADCSAGTYCKLLKSSTIGQKDGTVCPTPTKETSLVSAYSDQWGMICLVNTVTYVTNWLFYLMIIAVVIVFVIAGAMYMMAGGDSEKTKGAKGMMIYGIVGLVIALIAKLVPSVVKLIVGM